MNIGQRIKEVRKSLNIKTQQELADKLNTTRDRIANIELNRISIDDMFISYFCREFNINEHWLRTGDGKMFIELDSFSLDDYIKKKGLSEFAIDIVKSFVMMPKDIQEPLLNYLKDYFSIGSNDETAASKDRLPSDVSDAADEALQSIESKKEKLI